MKTQGLFTAPALAMALAMTAQAEVKISTARNSSDNATARYRFGDVPSPAKNDAAATAKFTLVDGARDGNGGELANLRDGRLPGESDQPSENFFFAQNTEGGRLLIDLTHAIEIKQVNTYSWHPGSRGPQVYKLYASDGQAEGFKAEPKKDTDPDKCGWKLIASIDTRPKEGDEGGQYGVSISDSSGALGKYRYLLFDIARTEARDPFGNTFYSEIDVIDRNASPEVAASSEEVKPVPPITKSFSADGGKYHFTINATAAPDLMEWADTELRPVVQEWYPKIVAMLPSEGWQPTTNVTIRFRDNMTVPASAGGGNINCNAVWFRKELKREARGSVVHEMVHIVQNYRGGRRTDTNTTRMPGWLVEGIPDYIRWFLYEPQTKGAEISKGRLANAKHDASYRVTGNFLNWVTTKYDTNLVMKLNAAGRQGKYSEEIWKTLTGKTVQELGADWKKALEEKFAAAEAPKETPKEQKN
jgi:hypothetical protein